MGNLSNKIIDGIRTVAGQNKLPLHEPKFDKIETQNLKKCIDTSYVSSIGQYVNIFEQRNIASLFSFDSYRKLHT